MIWKASFPCHGVWGAGSIKTLCGTSILVGSEPICCPWGLEDRNILILISVFDIKFWAAPHFFLFSFIAWISTIYSNLKMTLSIALIPSSNEDTDSFFYVCISLPVNFFFLPFKACLYINYVNFMYFFVPDVIWDYVISSNFAIIQRRFALKLNATDLQSMGPQRPQHNWATKHTHHNGSVGKCFWIHQK